MSALPLGYLQSAGRRADLILPLTWFTLIVSILVCLIVGVLLWSGVQRGRPGGRPAVMREVPLERGGDGIAWIRSGVLISAIPLLVTLVWTMVALAKVAEPPAHPALTLDITAHQWWWEVLYGAPLPAERFSTANEIHIPVGAPVLVRLHGGDVIHSFWVPQLSGKTDAIPGQTNLTWMQAARPGRYRGQCSEYCGFQHAHMGLEVVAEAPADFEQWRVHQLEPASAPATLSQQRGQELVQYRCGLCHQVRGTSAGARTAPDLTHLMSRQTLAAGTLLNNPANLIAWIQDPQSTKPGSLMPDQNLPAQQLSDVRDYLESLR